jgi:hypothetical protein
VNGDLANELAFELDFIVSTHDVAGGFLLMEYTRWVLPHFILMICTNGMLMLWILQHAQRPWQSHHRRPPDEPLPGFNAMSLFDHGAFFWSRTARVRNGLHR